MAKSLGCGPGDEGSSPSHLILATRNNTMALQAYCDNCGNRTNLNVATQPTIVLRERLEIEIKVTGFNGLSDPIICLNCLRLCVEHGEEHQDES